MRFELISYSKHNQEDFESSLPIDPLPYLLAPFVRWIVLLIRSIPECFQIPEEDHRIRHTNIFEFLLPSLPFCSHQCWGYCTTSPWVVFDSTVAKGRCTHQAHQRVELGSWEHCHQWLAPSISPAGVIEEKVAVGFVEKWIVGREVQLWEYKCNTSLHRIGVTEPHNKELVVR